MQARIFIYDDHAERIASLTALLSFYEEYIVVGSAMNCANVLAEVEAHRPHLILMDINMPVVDGLQGLATIKKQHPEVKVLMQTAFDDSEKIFTSIKNGASGYILKNDRPQRILQAIDEVLQGGAALNPAIAQKVLNYFAPKEVHNPLTPRENEVLKYLSEGFSYKMVADKLGINYTTVNTHSKRIYEKLHISSLGEAIAWYYNNRL
jgi:DNA-binding NarL/FixJ family response regulator